MKDFQGKLLMLLLTAVIGMATWQFVRLIERVDSLSEDVTGLKIAVEVAAGGNPFSQGGD